MRARDLLHAPGDTLLVLHLVRNLADTTVSVRVLPCGVRLVLREDGDGEVRPLEGPPTCDSVTRRLTPGDSIVAETPFEIDLRPGSYMVDVWHARLADSEGEPISGGFSLNISERSEAEAARVQSGVPRMRPRRSLDIVLAFPDDPRPDIPRRMVAQTLTSLLGQYGFSSSWSTREAARRRFPTPFILVDFDGEPGETGECHVRTIWSDVTDQDDPALTGYARCRESTGGSRPQFMLGAFLAAAVERLVRQVDYGICPPPPEP